MNEPSDYDLSYYDRRQLATEPPPVRDTQPSPPVERWPTLVSIGLGDALDSLERVTTWAQKGKHRGKKWSGQDQQHQVGKLLGHLSAGLKGQLKDEDTGEHPYAHVAARALMLLGLVLMESVDNGPAE